jgi:hypothetical protein
MSKSKGKNVAGAGERPREAKVTLSLTLAQKMLPLVSHIVADVQRQWGLINQLEAEQMDLDHRRRQLSWPERSRRYQVADELATAQRSLEAAVIELEQLEVLLVDPVLGEAAFPTVIHGRRGYFIWRAGTAELGWWCYAHDVTRHPIPATWRRSK